MRGRPFTTEDEHIMTGYADNIDMLVAEIEVQHRLHAEFRDDLGHGSHDC